MDGETVANGGDMTTGTSRRSLLKKAAVGAGIAWVAPQVVSLPAAYASGTACPRCSQATVLLNGSAEAPAAGSAPDSWTQVANARRLTYGGGNLPSGPTGSGSWYFDSGTGNNANSGFSQTITLSTCEQNLLPAVGTKRLGLKLTGYLAYGTGSKDIATLKVTAQPSNTVLTPFLTGNQQTTLSLATATLQTATIPAASIPAGTTSFDVVLNIGGTAAVADLLGVELICT